MEALFTMTCKFQKILHIFQRELHPNVCIVVVDAAITPKINVNIFRNLLSIKYSSRRLLTFTLYVFYKLVHSVHEGQLEVCTIAAYSPHPLLPLGLDHPRSTPILQTLSNYSSIPLQASLRILSNSRVTHILHPF